MDPTSPTRCNDTVRNVLLDELISFYAEDVFGGPYQDVEDIWNCVQQNTYLKRVADRLQISFPDERTIYELVMERKASQG